jgi:stage V sporulation protein G
MNNMEITSVNIKIAKDEGCVMAYVSMVIDDSFSVRKIRIIEKNGEFMVCMPSMKNKIGKYEDICHPINAHARKQIETVVLNSYRGQLQSEVVE